MTHRILIWRHFGGAIQNLFSEVIPKPRCFHLHVFTKPAAHCSNLVAWADRNLLVCSESLHHGSLQTACALGRTPPKKDSDWTAALLRTIRRTRPLAGDHCGLQSSLGTAKKNSFCRVVQLGMGREKPGARPVQHKKRMTFQVSWYDPQPTSYSGKPKAHKHVLTCDVFPVLHELTLHSSPGIGALGFRTSPNTLDFTDGCPTRRQNRRRRPTRSAGAKSSAPDQVMPGCPMTGVKGSRLGHGSGWTD